MQSLVNLFKALSDETRLRILNLLLGGELCVCELMDALQMSQPRISHQLRILKALEAKGQEDPASSLLTLLQSWITEGVFDRDRAHLQETLAKGLRTSCRIEAQATERSNQGNKLRLA
jgi:ArsR family transcriptional regulator